LGNLAGVAKDGAHQQGDLHIQTSQGEKQQARMIGAIIGLSRPRLAPVIRTGANCRQSEEMLVYMHRVLSMGLVATSHQTEGMLD
jgi:hypothetical protein